jgi:hypothetical protein
MITMGIQCGFGRHVWDINAYHTSTVIMYDYLAQTFDIAGGTLA